MLFCVAAEEAAEKVAAVAVVAAPAAVARVAINSKQPSMMRLLATAGSGSLMALTGCKTARARKRSPHPDAARGCSIARVPRV